MSCKVNVRSEREELEAVLIGIAMFGFVVTIFIVGITGFFTDIFGVFATIFLCLFLVGIGNIISE